MEPDTIARSPQDVAQAATGARLLGEAVDELLRAQQALVYEHLTQRPPRTLDAEEVGELRRP